MSGLYIPKIELPTCCMGCHFRDALMCEMGGSVPFNRRLDNCPLIEVPPHGRLIDADALHKLFEVQWHYLQILDWDENPMAEAMQSGINWCINTMHDDAPTVIEAEDGE